MPARCWQTSACIPRIRNVRECFGPVPHSMRLRALGRWHDAAAPRRAPSASRDVTHTPKFQKTWVALMAHASMSTIAMLINRLRARSRTDIALVGGVPGTLAHVACRDPRHAHLALGQLGQQHAAVLGPKSYAHRHTRLSNALGSRGHFCCVRLGQIHWGLSRAGRKHGPQVRRSRRKVGRNRDDHRRTRRGAELVIAGRGGLGPTRSELSRVSAGDDAMRATSCRTRQRPEPPLRGKCRSQLHAHHGHQARTPITGPLPPKTRRPGGISDLGMAPDAHHARRAHGLGDARARPAHEFALPGLWKNAPSSLNELFEEQLP